MFRAMGKVEIRIPLVTWRDGRPRFFPSPAARALGYKGEDLRHGKGRWFSLDEAIAWSTARQAEIAEKRQAVATGETTLRRAANETRRRRAAGVVTISQVMEAFRASPRMAGREIVQGKKKRRPLAETTIRNYSGAIRCLENFEAGQWWHEPAADLTAPVLDGLIDAIEQAHGLSQARAVRGVVSVAFGYCRTKQGGNLVDHNPVAESQVTLPMTPKRLRPATVEEFVTLLSAFDALGLAEAGDLFCAGAWTGQRQNDRRALTERCITADGIVFAPHKKQAEGQRLLIPLAAMLADRLDAARRRRGTRKVARLHADPPVFPDPRGRAWTEIGYGKVYRAVRHAVATGGKAPSSEGRGDKEWMALFRGRDVAAELAAASIAPLPSVADLTDQDLRDTCISWLPLAGANKWEIAGFSGHAFAGRENVLGHYLAIDPEFARAGMKKLEAWFARELAALEQRRRVL